MNGTTLTKKAIERIEAEGGKAINLISASKNGNADIIACIYGRYCEFEIKGTRDTEKSHQVVKLNETIKAGGIGAFIYNLAQLNKYISYAKLGTKCPLVKSKVRSFTL